jgi:RNA recognition motif-containing protein
MRSRSLSLIQRCYTTPNRLKARVNERYTDSASSSTTASTTAASKRIFVANLSPTTDWKELKDYFKQVGTVAYASISKDLVTNQSKGCGLIQFEDSAHNARAIDLLNGKVLNGSVISVREDRQEQKPKQPSPYPSTGGTVANSSHAASRLSPQRETDSSPSSSTRGREEKRGRLGDEGRRATPPPGGGGAVSKKPLSEEERALHRVFVSGLPLTYNWMDLKDYFKAVGPVRYCDIYTVPGSGKSKGSAVVEFEKKSDVARAVRLLHGAVLEPELMMIRVESFEVQPQNRVTKASPENSDPDSGASTQPPSSHSRSSGSTRLVSVPVIAPLVPILRSTPLSAEVQSSLALLSDSRVFVSHLPRDLDWKIIKDTFSVIGPVVHVEIHSDPRTGKSRGCGFVKFLHLSDAKRAIETLHHSEVEGKRIEVGEYHEERESRRDRDWRRNTFMRIRLPDERKERDGREGQGGESREVGRERFPLETQLRPSE